MTRRRKNKYGRNLLKAFKYEYYSRLVNTGGIVCAIFIQENAKMGKLSVMGSGDNQADFSINGIALPSIMGYSDKRGIYMVKQFGYEDFKGRLS